jgi:hypothetical protein
VQRQIDSQPKTQQGQVNKGKLEAERAKNLGDNDKFHFFNALYSVLNHLGGVGRVTPQQADVRNAIIKYCSDNRLSIDQYAERESRRICEQDKSKNYQEVLAFVKKDLKVLLNKNDNPKPIDCQAFTEAYVPFFGRSDHDRYI